MNLSSDADQTVQTYIEGLLFDSSLAGAVSEDLPVSSVAVNAAAVVTPSPAKAPATTDSSESVALGAKSQPAAKSAPGSNPDLQQPFIRRFAAAQQRARVRADASRAQNMPQWADKRFKCITFKVANLKLALPLSAISGMYPLNAAALSKGNDAVAELRDSGDRERAEPNLGSEQTLEWLLGSMLLDRPVSENSSPTPVKVIDTARMVMPERYNPAMREGYRSLLVINDCDWGFAVDAVGGEIELEASKVRWRSAHTRREWLAGTVVDKMCAIVDVDVVNRHLLADQILASNDDESR